MTPRTESPLTTWAYRPDIDGLRAIAVVAVVLFHAFPTHLTGGYVGVDIFFVISGFLITGIILTNLNAGRFTFQDFYARRIRRIFPALIVVLAPLLLFGWFTLMAGDYRQLGIHTFAASVFVSNIRLWNEAGYFDQVSWTKPLMHLWSLGVEEQFYLFWPAVVLLATRMRRLPLTLTIIAVSSLLFSVVWTAKYPWFAFYLPFTRLWELLAGAGVAYVTVFRSDLIAGIEANSGLRTALSIAGILLIAVAVVTLKETTAFPGAWAMLPVGGALLLILSGPRAFVNRALALNIVVWTGLISYPLYLWHWPVLTMVRVLGGGLPSVSTRVMAMAAALVLATATYLLIERPLRARRPTLRTTGVLAMLLVTLGGIGLVVRGSDGFPSRHPQIVEPVLDLDTQFNRQRCHLEWDSNHPVDFDPACGGPAVTTAPLVALVGDSHIGELSASMRNRQERDGFRLAQFTVGGCAPGATDTVCAGFFDFILDRLKTNPPQVVLLGARWRVGDAANVPGFLVRLRDTGVRHTIVVGPTPEWTGKPSRILFQAATGGSFWLSDLRKAGAMPRYASLGLMPDQFAADQELRKVIGRSVPYFSPTELFCRAPALSEVEGRECMTLTTTGEQVWGDFHHLSPVGSDLLVESILPRVRSFF